MRCPATKGGGLSRRRLDRCLCRSKLRYVGLFCLLAIVSMWYTKGGGGAVRGEWADAGSQPERPQSQAGMAPMGTAPVLPKEEAPKVQPSAAGMGISFKIGLGGAVGGVKSKTSAPAPQLFGADAEEEDEDDD